MKNPLGNNPEWDIRKLRGGHWQMRPKYYFRVETERDHSQTYTTDFIGFRLFRSQEKS